MPRRSPCRRTIDVSTPNARSDATHESPTLFAGIADTNRASTPNCASDAATFASAPPNVASSIGDWNSRSKPGDLSRSITSPSVTTRVIRITAGAAPARRLSDARRDSSRMRSNCFAAIQSGRRHPRRRRTRRRG